MNFMKPIYFKYIMIIVMLIAFNGCESNEVRSTDTPGPTTTQIPVTSTLTALPSTTPLTPISTAKPTSWPTQISSKFIFVRTPIPELTGDEIDIQISMLLETNNGCELPCWWGITPGKTDEQSANQILEPKSDKIWLNEVEMSINDEVEIWRYYDYEITAPGDQNAGLIILTVRKGVVEKIAVWGWDFDKTENYHSIDRVLEELGEPDEVMVYARPCGYETPPPWCVHLSLVYQNKSIVVKFATKEATIEEEVVGEGGIVNFCFEDSKTSFDLYPPDKIVQARDIFASGSPSSWLPFRSLDEATGMDTFTFFQRFLNPEEPFCLETSEDLWKK